jgi:hypothetical protein
VTPGRSALCLLALAALPAAAACRIRESTEAARAKTEKAFLVKGIAELEELAEKAEEGDLVTSGHIAIGVDETTASTILNASLPQEQVVARRIRIRIESVIPFFRGNQAAVVFKSRVTSEDLPNQFAALELAGALNEIKLVEGTLRGQVELAHFRVTNASVGPLAQGVVESLVRGNLGLIQDVIPPFQIPVRLDQLVRVDRFAEGPVEAAGGELPLAAEVAQVLSLNTRLWVLIEAKAGPWKAAKRPPTASVKAEAP